MCVLQRAAMQLAKLSTQLRARGIRSQIGGDDFLFFLYKKKKKQDMI